MTLMLRCLLVCALALLGCTERPGTPTEAARAAVPIAHCLEPAEGCACAGNQAPVACRPAVGVDAGAGVCLEGTRYCANGRYGACQDVKSYARPAAVSQTGLIDQVSDHPRCSDCEPNCHVVVDNLDPSDGKLAPSFATGVEYHGSGAGITLTPHMTSAPASPPDGGAPDGGLLLQVAEGLSDTELHVSRPFPERSDVYLLLDQSKSMAEETQWLYDGFDVGDYLASGTSCAGGDTTLGDAGVAGALRCVSPSVELGLGMFREIPFEPYASDQTLLPADRSPAALHQVAFGNVSDQDANLANVKSAFSRLGGAQPSGDPDVAGSQIPALHAVATGQGMFTGIGRSSVLDATCASGRNGYPCFRDGAQPIVVMVTDAPFHDGPDPASYPYDYDPADLGMLQGTTPGVLAVPPTSSDFGSALALPGDSGSTLRLLRGQITPMSGSVSTGTVGCQAEPNASDALLRFDVTAPGPAGSTVPVALSTEGSSLPTTLAVFDGPVAPPQQLPAADDANELFTSAYALGDLTNRRVVVSGDTTKPSDVSADMSADYQGALFGDACGASTLAPDAVFALDVGSAAGPTAVELDLDMGDAHPVLAVYEQGGGPLPPWPARANPLVASGNVDASPSHVFTIPLAAGNPYVSVTGDTSLLASSFDANVLGGTACSPDSASNDAAFKLHLDSTRTLRFDTEGSSFDTVLSLHRLPPMTKSGGAIEWPAAQTHQNHDETAATAYDVGVVNGVHQVFDGDTSGMLADVTDSFGCGMQDDCADAVYSIAVATRTTLRLQVTGQGFEPAAVVTRFDPAGSSGRYPPFALGENHTCALSGGGVYCWGADDVGQLGIGGGAGDPDSLAAAAVTSLSSIVQVAAGQNHTCALTAQGAVYCWGAGGAGQLGDGGGADRYAPVQVLGVGGSGTLSNAVQVACGAAHCCALEGDGTVVCWGNDAQGELGDGQSGTSSATPVAVSTSERFDQLVAAGDHSCAVRRTDKAVYCWGGGSHGKLGDGATSDNLVPGPVSGLSNVRSVMAGVGHDCAVLAQGQLMCWGEGADGKLGQGSDHADHDTPVAVLSAGSGAALDNVASSWAAGRRHTCAVLLSGLVRCFGDDGAQQLGDDGRSVGGSDFAVEVDSLVDAKQIVSAYDHTCVLRANGALSCWGDGAHGKLGNGSTSSAPDPVDAQSGAPQVAFGTGMLEMAFTQACASIAQAPDPGCTRAESGGRSYFICRSNPRTWSGAALACNAAGYQLVDLDTAGETAFVSAGLGTASWIGAKRESSADWLALASGYDFDDLLGNTIWHTEQVGHESCFFGFFCHMVPAQGFFTSYAAPDWVGDEPYSGSSTWSAPDEPSSEVGRNCAVLLPSGKLATDGCALSSTPIVVAGGFAAPPFAGGVRHDFACEERDRFTDVTLDPGRYFVTVKGVPSPQSGTCAGAYALHVDDLGPTDGGYLDCDDNGIAGSTASVIERTLPAGDYYLVLKGKRAGDAGTYALTVRDVDAVRTNEVGCDAGQGQADPAVVTFTAQPGKSYYALVKGESPLDKGPYTLNARSHKGTGDRVACDSGSAPNGASSLALDLPTGSYYALVTGHVGSAQGTFELSVGGASPVSATFVPPSYADTVAALTASHVRVATVLSCDSALASCTDAQAQAALLATDTGGVVRNASTPDDVPAEVAAAVRELERFDSVSAQLEFAPDANPGFVKNNVAAVMDPGNACMPGDDATSFRACFPGASPSFSVSLANPALQPVPPGSGPLGGYSFTLHVQGTRDGVTRYTEDVPVLVVPSGGTPPMTYDQGSYHQDFDSRGCGVGTNTRPSWDDLLFAADVRPDTRLDFYACTADVLGELASCDTGLPSSGYKRVLTVTAGQGGGKACSVATQDVDCPAGYCSPYTSLCNTLEGAGCGQDSECPGTLPGRCRDGPTATMLGSTCVPPSPVASIATALGDDNYHPVLRLRADLQSLGDGSRTPGLFFFEAKYRCRNVE